MALVKFGGGITEMTGSIAGNTFARNRSGFYVRARSKPVNPNTSRQGSIRAALAAITTRWQQTLTVAQRTAWGLYASSVAMKNRLGETIYLSGFNHYIRSNILLQSVASTPIDAGPVVFALPEADGAFTITASEATQQISVAFDNALAWANELGGIMWLFQGRPQNPQRNFFKGPWRRTSGINGGGVPPASPQLIDVVFAISEGQRQYMYYRIQRADGRLSEPFQDDVLTGA